MPTIAPSGSMMVAQFEPDESAAGSASGFAIPRGTELRSRLGRDDKTPCEFRTAHDVTLWPITITEAEYQFWNAYYNITPGVDSDWYSRLKGAAINMLALHDFDQGTGFTSNWPSGGANDPVAQNTRLGKESVICQKCHADNVIAVACSWS